jgi:hypothetical protein
VVSGSGNGLLVVPEDPTVLLSGTCPRRYCSTAAGWVIWTGADQMFSYHCAVPADLQAAYMPHGCDIISIFEGALRLAAAASEQTAGACVSTGPETAAKASGLLSWLVAVLARVLYPGYSGPLLELARTAGPGSQAQRQLHSLLASMVKLS